MSQLGLGEILQLRGWISRGQLVRALARQRKLGGRLGTSLLEIGAVTEDRLLTVLAEQADVPKGPIGEIRLLPQSLSSFIPADLARRRRILPIKDDGDLLTVAFEDASDLAARDELAFATRRNVRVVGLHEARIYEGLERLYGIECPPRFSRLLKELNRSRLAAANDDLTAGAPTLPHGSLGDLPILVPSVPTPLPRASRPQPAPLPQAVAGAPKAPKDPQGTEEDRESAPDVPTIRPGHRLKIVELTEGERSELARQLDQQALKALPIDQRLLRATRASEIGEAILDHLGKSYGRVALFRPCRGGFKGWMACGQNLDAQRFSELRIDSRTPSVFLNLQIGGNFYLGPLANHDTNRRFVSSWIKEGWPDTCGIVPIRSDRQTLCLLYVDTPKTASEVDIGGLQGLAKEALKAFENCILRNRLQSERDKKSV